jgi:hypothetical protein
MRLRRALLLFALVLGLAALATSVSRPRGERKRETPPPPAQPRAPEASPSPAPGRPARLTFSAKRRRPESRRLLAGRAAIVTVKVSEPGQVELEGLGVSAPAEPLTPARFDVLADEPARHAVRFTPASAGGESRLVGFLRVVRASPAT